MKSFIAIQTGARRNYAVPSILQKAGMLEAFYTDMCANVGLGALLNKFSPPSLRRGAVKRLLNRRVPPNLEGYVQTFDQAELSYLVKRRAAGNDALKQFQALKIFHRDFSRAMIRSGVGRATHVFSMHHEGSDFIEFARSKGLKIITEVFISPIASRIVQTERENFPCIENPVPDEVIEADEAWFRQSCDLTDVFITPSPFVEIGLAEFGVDKSKCRAVPYMVGNSWFEINNQSSKGRILFVGTANLRKGIHILGLAAQILHDRHYDFRIAGGVADKVRQHKLTKQLNFLGRVPRSEIQQEYAKADIFVLPSLAEGSAESTYEALAAGLPVITTASTGSVVRDGIEGFVVPERDANTLASRIEELIENRELRNRMAAAAKERAKDYTWEKYAERLMTVFQSV